MQYHVKLIRATCCAKRDPLRACSQNFNVEGHAAASVRSRAHVAAANTRAEVRANATCVRGGGNLNSPVDSARFLRLAFTR